MARDLTPLLFPRSVAVIGASSRPHSLAGAVLRNLRRGGFSGSLVAVHPDPGPATGVGHAASVADLGEPPDLAIWGVAADIIDRELPILLDRGTRAHLVLSAGYAESGPAGAERERALTARVRAAGGVLQGPNCMGLHVARPGSRLDASFSRLGPEPGPTALFVQSGSVTEWLLLRLHRRGVGAALAVSAGNMGDLDLLDYLETVPAAFPEVRQIFLYLETLPQAERLRRVLASLPSGLRVLGLRGGTTEAGTRAVAGHTGALASPPDLADALLDSAGVSRLRSLEHAVDTLELLDRLNPPRGRRVMIVTNAGGPGILAADALAEAGFALPSPSEALREALARILPGAASLGNPIDLLATATPELFRDALRQLAKAPDADVLVPIFMHPVTVDAGDLATALLEGLGDRRGDAAVGWMAGVEGETALAALRQAGVAAVSEPRRLAEALGTWAQAPSHHATPCSFPDVALSTPDRLRLPERPDPTDPAWGAPAALEAALLAPSHRAPESLRVDSVREVPAAASRLGFPLVLKIECEGIPHKRSAGFLAEVETPGDLEPAVATLRPRFPDGARWLLQRRVPSGPEVYAGFLRHPRLGPFLGLAPGGTRAGAEGPPVWCALPAAEETAVQTFRRSPLTALWGFGDSAKPGAADPPRRPGASPGAGLRSLLETLARIGLASPHVTMAEVNPAILDPATGIFWLVDCRWTRGRPQTMAEE